jgi:hypothetical protein
VKVNANETGMTTFEGEKIEEIGVLLLSGARC